MNFIERVIINSILGGNFILGRYRIKLYKVFGLKIKASDIRPKVYFNSKFITIGEGSFVNSFSQLFSGYNEDGRITIGNNCHIGMNVNICCISHEIGDSSQRGGIAKYKPIIINNGCWIGANSFIGQGVTIGEGCIIGAGSVVIRDCEPNCLYAGNPAKKIKRLN